MPVRDITATIEVALLILCVPALLRFFVICSRNLFSALKIRFSSQHSSKSQLPPQGLSSLITIFIIFAMFLGVTVFSIFSNIIDMYHSDSHKDSPSFSATSSAISNNFYEDSEELVWITDNGKRYHDSPSCSNMQDPYQVGLDEAVDMGLSPCKKCY